MFNCIYLCLYIYNYVCLYASKINEGNNTKDKRGIRIILLLQGTYSIHKVV